MTYTYSDLRDMAAQIGYSLPVATQSVNLAIRKQRTIVFKGSFSEVETWLKKKRHDNAISVLEESQTAYRKEHGNGNVRSGKEVADHMKLLGHSDIESVYVLTMKPNCDIIGTYQVAMGTVDSCHVNPRDIFRAALFDNASKIIVVHNHPSGALSASDMDKTMTTRIREGSKLMGIGLLDHVIVTKEGYYSFNEEGIL